MPTVRPVTHFFYHGQSYKDCDAIKTEVENQIGKIIDKFDCNLNAKQRLAILDGIVKNHNQLSALLDVTIEDDEEDTTLNILDVQL